MMLVLIYQTSIHVTASLKKYISYTFSNNSLPNWSLIKPLQSGVVFLHPLKTSKDLKVFWCFQGVQKSNTGLQWINWSIIQLEEGNSQFAIEEEKGRFFGWSSERKWGNNLRKYSVPWKNIFPKNLI